MTPPLPPAPVQLLVSVSAGVLLWEDAKEAESLKLPSTQPLSGTWEKLHRTLRNTNVLIVLNSLWFYMNCKVNLSNSAKYRSEDLIQDCIESDQVGEYFHLKDTKSSILCTWVLLLIQAFNFLKTCFTYMYKSYTSFVKFFSKYFILFDVIISWILNFIFRFFIANVLKYNWFLHIELMSYNPVELFYWFE